MGRATVLPSARPMSPLRSWPSQAPAAAPVRTSSLGRGGSSPSSSLRDCSGSGSHVAAPRLNSVPPSPVRAVSPARSSRSPARSSRGSSPFCQQTHVVRGYGHIEFSMPGRPALPAPLSTRSSLTEGPRWAKVLARYPSRSVSPKVRVRSPEEAAADYPRSVSLASCVDPLESGRDERRRIGHGKGSDADLDGLVAEKKRELSGYVAALRVVDSRLASHASSDGGLVDSTAQVGRDGRDSDFGAQSIGDPREISGCLASESTFISTDGPQEASPGGQLTPPPQTVSEHQRKCRSTVLRKNLPEYMKLALFTVVGAGSAETQRIVSVEADEVIDDILATVSNLDDSVKGLKWQSNPYSLNGIDICIQMKYLSGEAEEELWAVEIDTLVKTEDGQLALPDGQVVRRWASKTSANREMMPQAIRMGSEDAWSSKEAREDGGSSSTCYPTDTWTNEVS